MSISAAASFARQLDILPPDFAIRIADSLRVAELSSADLQRRQAAFVPLVLEAQRLPNRA